MNQQGLEDQGLGYRCRHCGITVLSTNMDQPWLCTACLQTIKRKLEFAERCERRGGWVPADSWPNTFKPAAFWREQLAKTEKKTP